MVALQSRFTNAYGRLCHFVAIRKDTASVTAAEDGVVRAAIYLSDNATARNLQEIAECTRTLFSLSFSKEEIDQSVRRLADVGQVVRNTDGSVTLSDAAVSELERCVDDSQNLESDVRKEWLQWLANGKLVPDGYDLDRIWRALQNYLAALFTRHGVQTLELLAPASVADESIDDAPDDILDRLVQAELPHFSIQSGRKVLQSFLSDRTILRTRYLSELLDGTFSFFALTVDDETRRLLRENLPPLKLFVDTNFIFDLLELHDNPVVALAKQLVDVIREQHFPFQLYYHPITADEFRLVMQYYHRRLAGGRWPSAMSRAMLRASELNSIEQKYHELNAEHAISVDDFFTRYNNLERLLGLAGVKPYRNAYELWLSDDITLNLISDYKRFLEPREKPFTALQHDIILWRTLQAVRHNKPGLFGEDAFFLTSDYTFWHFDHKRLSRNAIGISVLPNVLLQLLRPFLPRTSDFDRGFINTFALPEFRTIHTANPQAVARVAGIIRLYADLPEDVAVAILTDDALLRKVTGLDESDPIVNDLIESAIVAEATRWKREADRLAEQIRQEQVIARSTAESLAQAQQAAEQHVTALTSVRQQLEQERQARATVEARALVDRSVREDEIAKAVEAQSRAADEIRRNRAETQQLRRVIYALAHALLAFCGAVALIQYLHLTVREHNSIVAGAAVYGMAAVTAEMTAWFQSRKQRLLVRLLWILSCIVGVVSVIVGATDMTTLAILVGALMTLATALLTALFQAE